MIAAESALNGQTFYNCTSQSAVAGSQSSVTCCIPFTSL